MQVYYLIYIVALCLALYKKETKLSLLLLGFMFFVTAFRAETVGNDTMNYIYGFSQEAEGLTDYSSRTLEFLNLLLYFNVYTLGMDTRLILVVHAFITYFGLFIIGRQYKIRLSYLLLFFFLTSFFIRGLNISRQVTSIIILAMGLKYLLQENVVKSWLFFVFVLLAGGFHASSYIFGILYIFRFMHFRNKTVISIIAFILSLLIIVNIIPLEPIMMRLLPKEYGLYSQSLSHEYAGTSLGLLVIIFNLIIQCLILLKYDGKFYELYAFSVVLVSSTIGMDYVVSRITLFFSLITFLVFSSYFASREKNTYKYVLFFTVVITESYFAFNAIARDPDLVQYSFMPF